MKKMTTQKWLILVLIVDFILCGAFILTKVLNKPESGARQVSEANIHRICELATLDCFYHNVAEWSQDSYNIFGYGEKKVWIEYDGMVRVGIKAGNLKISSPDNEGVVTVTIPDATILDKDLDEHSIYEIDSEKTVLFWTDEVNTENRKEALINAQNDMEASAAKNEMIMGEALERAKKIIERNIVALGEIGGNQYKVKFVDIADEAEALAAQ